VHDSIGWCQFEAEIVAVMGGLKKQKATTLLLL